MKKSQWLYEISTFLLALLFLFTALSKLFDLKHFIKEIHNQVFPKQFTLIIVIVLPAIEILATILLFRLKTRVSGLWLSLVLMSLFTLYVALVTFHYFPKVPCACAGVFNHMTWPQHLIFNIVFTIIAATGLWLNRTIKILKSTLD